MSNCWGVLTCREAHHVLVNAVDRGLRTGERLRLRMHLFTCDACTRFLYQVGLLHQAMHKLGQDDGGNSQG